VGSGRASVRQDIVLSGVGVHDEHCLIVNDHDHDVVTLHPLAAGGLLAVDGQPVHAPTKLVQGSRPRRFQ